MARPEPMFDLVKVLCFDRQLADKITDFKFVHRFKSEAEVIRALTWFAMELIEAGEPAPLPGEDLQRVAAYRVTNPAKREGRLKCANKISTVMGREAQLRQLLPAKDEDAQE